MRQRLRRHLTKSLCAVSLAGLSTCGMQVGEGLFCDVVRGPIRFPGPVASVVVQDARPQAEAIDAQNRYGEAHCRWRG